MTLGIPQQLTVQRDWSWKPLSFSCDEYHRIVWWFSLPLVGSVQWHRGKLCWICLWWDHEAVAFPGECAVPDARARVRVYRMWSDGIRLTGRAR